MDAWEGCLMKSAGAMSESLLLLAELLAGAGISTKPIVKGDGWTGVHFNGGYVEIWANAESWQNAGSLERISDLVKDLTGLIVWITPAISEGQVFWKGHCGNPEFSRDTFTDETLCATRDEAMGRGLILALDKHREAQRG